MTVTEPIEGYKETEIGVLPDDWDARKLSQLFEIQQGKALAQKHKKGISPHPFLRTANVFWGRVDLTNIDWMDFTSGEIDKLALRDGDLLVCEGGDIGRTAIWRGQIDRCCYQNHLHRLRPKDSDAFPLFYMFWMQASILLLGLYVGTGNKTTIPNLSRGRLSEYLLPLPPLPEQQKISSILSTIQEAKEKTENVIKATKELKKSMMKHLFTYGAVPVEEAERVPLKETEIGMIPEHWEMVRLEDLITKTKQMNPENTPDGEFKYIDVSGINRETLTISDYKSYVGKDAPSRARKLVETGDVIFATVRPTLKRVALIDENFHGEICSTAFCVLRARRERVLPPFIYHTVSRESFIDGLGKIQRGASYPAVTDTDVKRQKIPLPPLNEQEQIVETLTFIDNKTNAEEFKRRSLDTLFKTLLSLLMTGKLRVKDLEIPV